MTRPVNWTRFYNRSFNWQLGFQGNELITALMPGETLTRTILSVRFWAAAVDQTNPTEHSLYVPYVFGLLWADPRVIPNADSISLSDVMTTYPDQLLWVERFTMRDAYTPPKFASVNLGWIDDRPDMTVDARAQRLNDRTDGLAINLNFLWQANSTLLADPLAFTPLCTASVLIREPANVP